MSLSEFSLIGCRISITSKAKIRYEGYLHSVDFDSPNEPVITLSKVWSFGTEDRQCERVVAPRNEEYNQVVFRGRDLEDVHLVKSSVFLNEDSAIVSAAPGSSISNQAKQQTEDINRDLLPNGRPVPSTENLNLPFGQAVTFDNFNPILNQPASSNLIHGNAQTLQSPSQIHDAKQHGPRPFGDGRSEGECVTSSSFRSPDANRLMPGRDNTGQRPTNNTFDWGTERLYDRGLPRMGNHYRANQPFYGNHYSSNSHDYWGNRRPPMDSKWHSGKPGRAPQGGYRRRGSRSNGATLWSKPSGFTPSSATDATTFSEEYDYEKANAELAAVLEGIHISNKSTSSTDNENAKDDESTASLSVNDPSCYDKTRSFFDTLSSEMMDKANGVSQHGLNRREERLLNTTTFGVAPPPQYYRRPGRSGGGGGYGYGHRRGGRNHWMSSGPRNNNNNGNIDNNSNGTNRAVSAQTGHNSCMASFPYSVSTLSPSHTAS